MYLNRIQITGRLTRNPELRVSPKGTAVCSFAIANNRPLTTKQRNAGQKPNPPVFVECVAFDAAAQNVEKYFKSGSPIYIEGELQLDQWEDKESGQKRSRHKIVVSNFQFLEAPAKPTADNQAGGSDSNTDEDVPF
jgi:single-strand DNA-binding protein